MAELDCDKLRGRLRDICRGHDDAGRPVLTPEKCAAYRQQIAARMGVEPQPVEIGPNGKPRKVSKSERRKRIAQRTARRQRLIDWVMSCRQAGERGLGDVLLRVVEQARGKEIRADLRRLLKICSCREDEAVERLNAQYPAKDRRWEDQSHPAPRNA